MIPDDDMAADLAALLADDEPDTTNEPRIAINQWGEPEVADDDPNGWEWVAS